MSHLFLEFRIYFDKSHVAHPGPGYVIAKEVVVSYLEVVSLHAAFPFDGSCRRHYVYTTGDKSTTRNRPPDPPGAPPYLVSQFSVLYTVMKSAPYLKTSPTIETYLELQRAYDHFNKELFDGALPFCLITLQRDKTTLGYFSAERFARHSGELSDEIAMNPSYFAVRGIKDTLSTLAHEQVHLWQKHHGRKPGRGRYHNREWAERMIALGLQPTHNGKPGGNIVGEHMDHIIVADGPFDKSFHRLVTQEYRISWYDRFLPRLSRLSPPSAAGSSAAPGPSVSSDIGSALLSALLPAERKPQTRAKYTCPSCEINVWGKPGLNITCDDCRTSLEEQ